MRSFTLLLITIPILAAGASRIEGVKLHVERDWWSGGVLKREAQYAGEVLNGIYRTWYQDGQPYEIRHYVAGREQGLQRAWTPNGELYLNYAVRNGRRYGYVNAQPCLPVTEKNVTP